MRPKSIVERYDLQDIPGKLIDIGFQLVDTGNGKDSPDFTFSDRNSMCMPENFFAKKEAF